MNYKYFYTYKIILLKGSLAGKYYYGQHKTNRLNDSYAGSGKIIKAYFKKYGAVVNDTYIKEITSRINIMRIATSKPVYQFDLNDNFIREYQSAREASRITGIANSSISAVCRGKRSTAGNFKWSYSK